MLRYDGGEKPTPILSDKYEQPGPSYNPLLATLSTGPARLHAIELRERLIADAGLEFEFKHRFDVRHEAGQYGGQGFRKESPRDLRLVLAAQSLF